MSTGVGITPSVSHPDVVSSIWQQVSCKTIYTQVIHRR